MKGVTVDRPLPWAIINDTVNFICKPYRPDTYGVYPGEWLALHAGNNWNRGLASKIEILWKMPVPNQREHAKRVIFAVARFTGVRTTWNHPLFVPPYVWLLQDIKQVVPIIHKGGEGLWEVEQDALDELKHFVD